MDVELDCRDDGVRQKLKRLGLPDAEKIAILMRVAFPSDYGRLSVVATQEPRNTIAFCIQKLIRDGETASLGIEFAEDEEGKSFANFLLYSIPTKEQRRGQSRYFVREFWKFAHTHKLSYVSAFAGLSLGGYAWARMGGVPCDPASLRQELRARLRIIEKAELGPADVIGQIRRHTAKCNDNDLMSGLFDIASQEFVSLLLNGRSGPDSVANLMEPINWQVIWPLYDAEYADRLKQLLEL